jgi:hypothetical protein
MMYTPSNWYWIVGDDESQVWSSRLAAFVPADDPAYVSWLAMGGVPTRIATMDELYDVLATAYPAGSLPTYNADARWRRENSGIIITSISPVSFTTDLASRNAVDTAWAYMNSKGTVNSISWKMSDGSFITMTTAQVTTLMNDITAFIQACFEVEKTNSAAINDETITTLDEIDAAFAAIPTTFP